VRTTRGLRERTLTSPFLGEMPAETLTVIDRTGLGGIDSADEGSSRFGKEPGRGPEGQFARGQLVRHPQFGLGRIADVSEVGQHTRAVVEFNEVGRKTLILQYARLEIIR